MKTDNLFYHIFLNYPQIFFELIEKPKTNINDYEFTSREIKQLSFRLDGLFLPKDNKSNQTFYLVEVQFQSDEKFYYRLFSEFLLFLRQYEPPFPWKIIVIYPSRKIEVKADLHFKSFLALEEVQIIYLDELQTNTLGIKTVKLFIESKDEAVKNAKILINQAQKELQELKIQKKFIDLIETIIVYKLPEKSREEIETMLGLHSIKETKVYQEAFAEGKADGIQLGKQEGIQLGKQEGIQLGKQEGIQLGKQEGIQLSKQEAIINMNNLGLDRETIAKYLNLSVNFVEKFIEENKNNENISE